MKRAEAAMAEMEGAVGILALCAKFCAEPESFGPFMAWMRREIEESNKGSEKEKAEALDAAKAVTPELIQAAPSVILTFLAGFSAQLRRVPDSLLDIFGAGYRP